jgi:exodeoxyribonuclease V beta subunit
MPDAIAALDFLPLRGLLTGAIDLVARHDGRWYLLDYKSNHLGDSVDDYAMPPMTHAMTSHHYVLQYHLYLVALHRFLRARQPAYDYDEHVGGIAYLFVRGLDAAHPGAGVFVDRPPRARIEALDAALRDGEPR